MKQEGIQQGLQEDHRTGVWEASSWIFCWVPKNQGLDVVEGSAPSETKEEPSHSDGIRGARNVEAPTIRDSFARSVGKEKLWMRVMHLD
jgi:hypothetical protein